VAYVCICVCGEVRASSLCRFGIPELVWVQTGRSLDLVALWIFWALSGRSLGALWIWLLSGPVHTSLFVGQGKPPPVHQPCPKPCLAAWRVRMCVRV